MSESKYIHKSHNVSVLLYHFVCPAKYRKVTQLWGVEFCTDEYFVNTVSKFGDETTISKYVREQGIEKDYTVLHKAKQLDLF